MMMKEETLVLIKKRINGVWKQYIISFIICLLLGLLGLIISSSTWDSPREKTEKSRQQFIDDFNKGQNDAHDGSNNSPGNGSGNGAGNQKTNPVNPYANGLKDPWLLECLNEHNMHRQKLETIKDGKPITNLTWDPRLQFDAKRWARHLADVNSGLVHSSLGHGENLYSETNGKKLCRSAVLAWFNEYSLYHNEKIGDGDFHEYGHYTQLAWPSTQKIGCDFADNRNTRYVVCEYDPPVILCLPELPTIVEAPPQVVQVISSLLLNLNGMETQWETKISKINDLSASLLESSICLNHKINIMQTMQVSFKTHLANVPKVLKISDTLLNVHDDLIIIYGELLSIYKNLSDVARQLVSITDNNTNLLHNYEDLNQKLRFYFEASHFDQVGYWSSILYWKNVFTILKEKAFHFKTLIGPLNRDYTVQLMILAKELLIFTDQRLESFRKWVFNASSDISRVVSIVESFIPEDD